MNESGIYPTGAKILIKPDEIPEEISEGGIILPESEREKYEAGQASGTLIAHGPDFCNHVVEKDSSGAVKTVRGYSQPFAKIGDRIAFAKYGGLRCKGGDGENYVICNDEDITAVISDEVEFTDLARIGTGLGASL
jgi:co-chaperonin GroES (HSP10)